ncbi:MAG: sulfotransferase [Mucilaginibacter sp.]
MDNAASNHTLQKWIPSKLFFEDGNALCQWLYTGDIRFTHPFFAETIGACKQHIYKFNPTYRKSVSDISLIPIWAEGLNTVKPSAFIFHVSRCGSTLATQLLGINERHITLSEVPFFDELLRNQAETDLSVTEFNDIFKAALNFYGQQRTGSETKLFIKTDSWHVLFYKQLRELYPDVPFILLYRDPDEVMRSQQKIRGTQAVPGLINPALFGFDAAVIRQLSLDEYMAKVLERYYTCFLDIIKTDDNAHLVNYCEGPIEIVKKIAAISQTVLDEDDMALINQRAGFHSKHPGQIFAEEKNKTPILEYLYQAAQLYAALEEERKRLT